MAVALSTGNRDAVLSRLIRILKSILRARRSTNPIPDTSPISATRTPQIRVIDYDDIETWSTWFDDLMREIGPTDLVDRVRDGKPKYTNDAEHIVVKACGREQLIARLTGALGPFHVRVYHGTRVAPADAAAIRREGLKPLLLADRRASIVSIFEFHPRWADVADGLDQALIDFGARAKAGTREDDRIHVCFSREGLLRGCNHYLCYGAEVDGHIAHQLFGDDSANALFAAHRVPLLVRWVVPYAQAEKAASPHGWDHDRLPSLMSCLVTGWAYRLAHPDFSIRRFGDAVAGWFDGTVTASQIERIEELTDADLAPLHELS